jgi:hypothetical protein
VGRVRDRPPSSSEPTSANRRSLFSMGMAAVRTAFAAAGVGAA